MNKFNENSIQEAAYYNWQNAGCPQGQDEYFWAMAIEQYNNCSCSKKASTSSSSSSSSAKKSSSKSSSTSSKAAACKSSTTSKKSK